MDSMVEKILKLSARTDSISVKRGHYFSEFGLQEGNNEKTNMTTKNFLNTVCADVAKQGKGLQERREWHQLKKMFPPLEGKKVLDLGCGYGLALCVCGGREQGAFRDTGNRCERADDRLRQINAVRTRASATVFQIWKQYEYPERRGTAWIFQSGAALYRRS